MKKSYKISPKDDFMFKAIFTRKGNNDLLEDLIESIIGRKVKCKSISKEARVGQINRNEKYGALDIRVNLETGEELDIEIQLDDKKNVLNRSVHYASVLSAEELKPKEDYANMGQKIIIFLLDYTMFKYDEVVNESFTCFVKHREKEEINLHKYYFVELPKINNIKEKEMLQLKRWILFLNEEWEELEKLGKGKIIQKAIAEYEYLTGDEEIKRLEYLKNKAFRDEAACRRIGLEEGMEKGLIKGKKEATNKIAKQFLGKGIDIGVISECTGLSKKEVQRLMDKIT